MGTEPLNLKGLQRLAPNIERHRFGFWMACRSILVSAILFLKRCFLGFPHTISGSRESCLSLEASLTNQPKQLTCSPLLRVISSVKKNNVAKENAQSSTSCNPGV